MQSFYVSIYLAWMVLLNLAFIAPFIHFQKCCYSFFEPPSCRLCHKWQFYADTHLRDCSSFKNEGKKHCEVSHYTTGHLCRVLASDHFCFFTKQNGTQSWVIFEPSFVPPFCPRTTFWGHQGWEMMTRPRSTRQLPGWAETWTWIFRIKIKHHNHYVILALDNTMVSIC